MKVTLMKDLETGQIRAKLHTNSHIGMSHFQSSVHTFGGLNNHVMLSYLVLYGCQTWSLT